MSSTILLIVLLSAHITGLSSKQLLKATVGGSVLFPCSLHDNGNLSRVYWQEGKEHFFEWDNGNITKDPSKYKTRTQFFDDEFSSGNIAFRLDNISVEDDQKTFFAYVKFDGQIQSERRCESTLQVSAPYQDLVLTVNKTTNSATCRARGGYPAAQVSWKGLNRSSDEQLDLQDAETFLQQDPTEKTFSFTSSVNVTGLKSVTCIVYNPHSYESINKTVEIDTAADPLNPTSSVSTSPPKEEEGSHVAVIVPVVLVILVIVGAVLFCRWYRSQHQPQAQIQDPDPPNEPPVEHDPHDGAQAEAADAPGETVSLTGTGAAYRRRTKSSEDAAASPEKENLLK